MAEGLNRARSPLRFVSMINLWLVVSRMLEVMVAVPVAPACVRAIAVLSVELTPCGTLLKQFDRLIYKIHFWHDRVFMPFSPPGDVCRFSRLVFNFFTIPFYDMP